MDKSKGHVTFINGYEYFKDPDGVLYKAKSTNYIGINGYRVGARFEATVSAADHHLNCLSNITLDLERLGDPKEA